MRLALVNVPKPNLADPGALVPLGTAYLAAAVRGGAPGVQCDVINLSTTTVADAVDRLRGWDVYGFSATNLDYPIAVGLARNIKREEPGAVCILGGPHVTVAFPRCMTIDPVFDTLFIGEGELTLPEYLQRLQTGGPERVVHGRAPTNLDALPFPVRDYTRLGHGIIAGQSESTAALLASRGCPYSCAFCCNQALRSRRVRYRSPANVAAEIRAITEKASGPVNFWFADDTLCTRQPYFGDLTARLRELQVKWRGSIRADGLTRDVAEALVKSGCVELAIGAESFDDHVLKVLNKRTTCAQNVNAVRVARAAGIPVRVLLMIGTPGESAETPERNISALTALRGCFSTLVLSRFVPLPGSPIFDMPAKYGVELLETDPTKMDFRVFEADMQTMRPMKPAIRVRGLSMQDQETNARRMWEFVFSERERINGGASADR